MYNLISLEHRRLVNEIIEMGHKVSVHFDPTAYDKLDKFENEKNLFEQLFKVEVDITSIHRPGSFLDNNNISLCRVPQTYNDKYFKSMKYISDSGGKDVKPQLAEYFKGSRKQGLHLLIHPIWWVENGRNATETLDFWRRKKSEYIKLQVRKNCRTYEG